MDKETGGQPVYAPRNAAHINILALIGSPRKGGNTDTLIDRVVAGIRSQNDQIAIEKIYVSDLDMQFCQGDLSCRKTGKCVIADDVSKVLDKLKRADALIVGSPLYGGYISGQMKVLLDRFTPLERDVDSESMQAGKGMRMAMGLLARVLPMKLQVSMMAKMAGGTGHLSRLDKKVNSVVVVTGAHPDYILQMKTDLELAAKKLSFLSLISGGRVVRSILAPEVLDKGDVLNKPRLLDQAFQAGKQLASNVL